MLERVIKPIYSVLEAVNETIKKHFDLNDKMYPGPLGPAWASFMKTARGLKHREKHKEEALALERSVNNFIEQFKVSKVSIQRDYTVERCFSLSDL